MQRIGVVSDTHLRSAPEQLPGALVSALEGTDLILHAGDHVVMGIVDQLELIAPTVAVHGNMDTEEVREAYPKTRVLRLDGYVVGLAHGWGSPARLAQRILDRYDFDGHKLDVLVFGHSHCALDDRVNGVRMFNPGSAAGFRAGGTVGRMTLTSDGIGTEIVSLQS